MSVFRMLISKEKVTIGTVSVTITSSTMVKKAFVSSVHPDVRDVVMIVTQAVQSVVLDGSFRKIVTPVLQHVQLDSLLTL
jgi:hypothetical protein